MAIVMKKGAAPTQTSAPIQAQTAQEDGEKGHVRRSHLVRSTSPITSLVHLVKGAKFRSAFKWKFDHGGQPPQTTYDYRAIKLFLDGGYVTQVKKGETVFLRLINTFHVMDKTALFTPSSALCNLGVCTGTVVIPAGDSGPLGMWFTAGVDVDLSTYITETPLAYLSLLS